MRILYLYAEVFGYTMATIRELTLRYGAKIHVVHWDKEKLTPFQHECTENVSFYPRSEYSVVKMEHLARNIRADLVVCSGWMDNGYLQIARMLRKKGVPVVTAIDTQWNGTIRQHAASIFGFYLKRYFSHAWVAGSYQFEFARRLGFKKKEIILDLYSADTDLFNAAHSAYKKAKESRYPHRFLFVGRLEYIKAVDLLVDAWAKLEEKKKHWELTFVGNGSLKDSLQKQSGITVKHFMQPDFLTQEIRDAGCFILPSRREPWGVVIHEFAAAGLPLICSDACGAAQTFLIHGLNGFRFESGNVDSLANQMLKIVGSADEVLYRMSEQSHELAQRITPTTSATNLISIIMK